MKATCMQQRPEVHPGFKEWESDNDNEYVKHSTRSVSKWRFHRGIRQYDDSIYSYMVT